MYVRILWLWLITNKIICYVAACLPGQRGEQSERLAFNQLIITMQIITTHLQFHPRTVIEHMFRLYCIILKKKMLKTSHTAIWRCGHSVFLLWLPVWSSLCIWHPSTLEFVNTAKQCLSMNMCMKHFQFDIYSHLKQYCLFHTFTYSLIADFNNSSTMFIDHVCVCV